MGQCYIRNRGANKPLIIEYNTVWSHVSTWPTTPDSAEITGQETVTVGLNITPTILFAVPTHAYEGRNIHPYGTAKDAEFVDGKYEFTGLASTGLSEPQIYYYVGAIIPNVTPNESGWIDTPVVYGNILVGTIRLGTPAAEVTWTSPNLPFHPRYALYGQDGFNDEARIVYWNGQLKVSNAFARLTCNENSITLTGKGAGKFIAWG